VEAEAKKAEENAKYAEYEQRCKSEQATQEFWNELKIAVSPDKLTFYAKMLYENKLTRSYIKDKRKRGTLPGYLMEIEQEASKS
jgi:hypothetical protein